MKEKFHGFLLFLTGLCLLLAAPVSKTEAALQAGPAKYTQGDAVLEGYLVYDDAFSGTRPGVLVFHEWKGLNDYAKRRAGQLAGLGYVALAADMYGKGVRAQTHDEAATLSGIYKNDRSLMRERAKAALDTLAGHELVDRYNMAAVGYCFGGTTVLEMARAGMDLKGVVSFHGALSTPLPAEAGKVRARILVLHGAEDTFVNPEVMVFQNEMSQAGTDWQLVSFGGAVHSFTVPSAGNNMAAGMAYNEKADRRSWEIMKLFFEEIFPAGKLAARQAAVTEPVPAEPATEIT